MIHPIPEGTRDILPDEMLELRRIEQALRETFLGAGYGEVATPALEYHAVLERGGGTRSAFRIFDETGGMLALRSDITVPIARLVQSRLNAIEPPHRLCYFGNSYRSIRPQRGQMREFMQAGIELVGGGGQEPATTEVIRVLSSALDAIGLTRAVIGLGDADLYRALMVEIGLAEPERDAILAALLKHDLVELRALVVAAGGLQEGHRRALIEIPTMRGGPEVIACAIAVGGEPVRRASDRLARTCAMLDDLGIADRVQLDLGLLRDLDYYTGVILEVYDPALGHILGGGGQYDALLGRYGPEMPATGFSLYVERLHIAQAEEERISRAEAAGPD